jgi:hypothetical protein
MSLIRNGRFIKDGIPQGVQLREGFKQSNLQAQRNDHQADVLQRYVGGKPNGEWIRMYPEEAKVQFSEQEIRTYGNSYGV